mmetsp:Transcript_33219/g.106055  ORF Transcript_33219/g.106055 Transcript_33219/m.106055 type:complete len:138 (+) Transcript_33219:13-426(+)
MRLVIFFWWLVGSSSAFEASRLRGVVCSQVAAALIVASPCGATEALFEANCAACHAGGGNVVSRGKTLKMGDLEANASADMASLVRIIADGKGAMPGYGETCAPKGACTFGKRLSDDDIEVLAKYVLDQAQGGWVTR